MSQLLWVDDNDRFQPLRLIPWWQQEKLSAARVLVVGAGALGNEAIKNLALLGVGHIDIVDMDTIETTNLTRSILFRAEDCGQRKSDVAARVASQISPTSRVESHVANIISQIGLGLFSAADIVLSCLDNREARLWVNRCCWRVGRPWIDAGIQEIHGVVQLFGARQSPCYECGMKDLDYTLSNLRYSCPLLQREDITLGRIPTTPTVASMIAAWQVQLAVKAIHGLDVPWGQAIVFNGLSDSTYRTKLPEKLDCLSHEAWQISLTVPHTLRDESVENFLSAVKNRLHAFEDPILVLEREFVSQVTCDRCGKFRLIGRPRLEVRQEDSMCLECNDTCRPEVISEVAIGHNLAKHTLGELGVPMHDWIQVRLGERTLVVELSDQDRLGNTLRSTRS